jgi:hypothetical protein
MPMKYKDFDTNQMDALHAATPIVEKLEEKQKTDAISDMMSNIIDEKQTLKNTSMIDMAGVLTPIDYYHIIPDKNNNYATDTNAPNDIAINQNKFYEIKNFKVKFPSKIELELDSEENDKSYITTGSIIILPRTIKPNENDMFIMRYYGKLLCYRITKVSPKSFEQDSGFDCEFSLYKADYEIDKSLIVSTYNYIQELVGTTYRPILTSVEYEQVQKCEKLYNHLSSVFNTLFYDRTVNGYFLKDYDPKISIDQNNNNIVTNHVNKDFVFRSSVNYDPFLYPTPKPVKKDKVTYDNFLNKFIADHRIFRSFDGLLLSTECLLPLDRIGYKRSIFGCLETQSCANYKNTFLSPIEITVCQPGLSAYFVGKTNILHLEGKISESEYNLIPSLLINQLLNGKMIDMKSSFIANTYASLDAFIIETITRYTYSCVDDFIERFIYLYGKLDDLYEHSISYVNIYYLFPMLGYVIEQIVEKTFKDNVLFK